MKIIPSVQLAVATAFLCAGGLFAQSTAAGTENAGLLGQKFTGVDFGYTHHVESAPKSLRRYGFVSQAPLAELTNVDAAFHYDFIRGSSLGLTNQTHRTYVSFTRYFEHRTVKPFAQAAAGWAWSKTGPVKEDSFFYRGVVGAEVGINPNVALTPFVSIEEAANIGGLGDRAWNIGAKLAYRLNRNWVPTLRVQIDDDDNIEYAVGMNYRF